jgi:hypothetical protein
MTDMGIDRVVITPPPAAPTVSSFTPNTNLCINGGQTVTITGTNFTGTSAVTFNGVNAASFSVVSSTTITAVTPAALGAGIITVTTLGGSANSVAYTVIANPTAAINPTSAAVCSGTPVALTASGGTTYAWLPATGLSATNTASVTASPTTTTTYTVTVTGSNGCTATSTQVVTVATAITATASATPSAICVGGNSQLNVAVPLGGAIKITEVCLNRGGTGGGVYPAFAPGADLVEITNISSSPIDISGWTLSDHASNTAAATHTGFAFPASTIIPANSVAVVCLGTGTNDVPNRYYNTGGTSDFWLSSGLVGIVLKNGSTVVDAVGCGSAYVFNAGTGVTAGDWSGFAPSASGLAGTTRTAAVDNNTGANWSAAGVVTQTIGVYNAGFTAPITISSYAWTPSTYIVGQEALQNPLATAVMATQTYNVVVTTSEGCTATSSVTVSASAALTATPTATPATICAGASSTLAAGAAGGGAPYTYLWSNPAASTTATVSVSPSSTTTYTVTVTDACLATATASVTVNPLPSAAITANPSSASICGTGSVILNVPTGATTYAWLPATGLSATNTASVTASPTTTTTYTVTVTGSNGCTATSTQVVTVATAITATASATPSAICVGGNSQLNVAVPLGGAIKITEVCLNRGGTGGGVYPAFAPGADLVEITNISSSPIDISGWTLSDHASNTAAATHTGFAFPASTIIPANSVAVVCLGTGTNDVPNRYYNTGGTSDFWLSSGLVGIVLKNGSTVVDAVGCGSAYVFNAGTGVTAGDWSGFAPNGSGLAGTTRTAAVDNNTGANWSAAGVVTQTIGVYNAGFTPPPTISSYAWTPSTYIVGQEALQNPLATAVLATQTYNVVVTTSEGCTATSSVTVTAGIPLTATPTATPATICAGASTTLAAVAAGGGAPYTYMGQWSRNRCNGNCFSKQYYYL